MQFVDVLKDSAQQNACVKADIQVLSLSFRRDDGNNKLVVAIIPKKIFYLFVIIRN